MFQLHTQIQTMVRWGNGLKVLLFYDRIHCLLGTCRCVTACTSYMGHSIVWQDLLLIWDMLLYDCIQFLCGTHRCMTGYTAYMGRAIVWLHSLFFLWDTALYDRIHSYCLHGTVSFFFSFYLFNYSIKLLFHKKFYFLC